MNRYAIQLISRGAINKIGNMLYDYGNSVWFGVNGNDRADCSLGFIKFLKLVTSILVNPFGSG